MTFLNVEKYDELFLLGTLVRRSYGYFLQTRTMQTGFLPLHLTEVLEEDIYKPNIYSAFQINYNDLLGVTPNTLATMQLGIPSPAYSSPETKLRDDIVSSVLESSALSQIAMDEFIPSTLSLNPYSVTPSNIYQPENQFNLAATTADIFANIPLSPLPTNLSPALLEQPQLQEIPLDTLPTTLKAPNKKKSNQTSSSTPYEKPEKKKVTTRPHVTFWKGQQKHCTRPYPQSVYELLRPMFDYIMERPNDDVQFSEMFEKLADMKLKEYTPEERKPGWRVWNDTGDDDMLSAFRLIKGQTGSHVKHATMFEMFRIFNEWKANGNDLSQLISFTAKQELDLPAFKFGFGYLDENHISLNPPVALPLASLINPNLAYSREQPDNLGLGGSVDGLPTPPQNNGVWNNLFTQFNQMDSPTTMSPTDPLKMNLNRKSSKLFSPTSGKKKSQSSNNSEGYLNTVMSQIKKANASGNNVSDRDIRFHIKKEKMLGATESAPLNPIAISGFSKFSIKPDSGEIKPVKAPAALKRQMESQISKTRNIDADSLHPIIEPTVPSPDVDPASLAEVNFPRIHVSVSIAQTLSQRWWATLDIDAVSKVSKILNSNPKTRFDVDTFLFCIFDPVCNFVVDDRKSEAKIEEIDPERPSTPTQKHKIVGPPPMPEIPVPEKKSSHKLKELKAVTKMFSNAKLSAHKSKGSKSSEDDTEDEQTAVKIPKHFGFEINRSVVEKTGILTSRMIRMKVISVEDVLRSFALAIQFCDTVNDDEEDADEEEHIPTGLWYIIKLLIGTKQITLNQVTTARKKLDEEL
ncbi:hypothetical protein HK098_008310 [Nowakowskiella sp. JEL0407]|nr:hypothetical protein HK098_008310 [Nowakowskiella sp. JEL0407]